jgi:type II secretory pathway component PulF
MAQDTSFEFFGRLLFTRGQVKRFETDTAAAGLNVQPDAFAGYLAMNVIIIAVILSVVLMVYPPTANFMVSSVNGLLGTKVPAVLTGLLVLIIMLVLVYITVTMLLSTYLIMQADARRNALEAALPDFLTLVASNIKAGMTLDQAMWYSAKPEFGLLSTEVKAVVKSSFSGQSMENALDTLASRFDSKVFTRTTSLMKQASASGGELTEVLERTAEDVRNTSIMRKEIAASLILYEIFVIFASMVGTPFLFAVSEKLVEVFEKIAPQMPTGQAAGGAFGALSSFSFSGPMITSTQFVYFAIPTMIVTAATSSLIVSVIRTGTRSQGLKYFPFLLVGALLVYWFVSATLNVFFSTLI